MESVIILAIGAFACFTIIMAGRQARQHSYFRLYYEITSLLPGIACLLQINGYSPGMDDTAWTLVWRFYPVVYWTLLWYKIAQTYLGGWGKLISGAVTFGLLGTVVEVPNVPVSGTSQFCSIIMFVVYAPLWYGGAMRIYGKFHNRKKLETMDTESAE